MSDSRNYESLENLKALYTKAKENNAKHNITGVLIYHNGNFLQVLEGQRDHVDYTYEKIRLDSRHKNILKVINIDVEQRIFEDYNFGFTVVDDIKEFNQLHEYLEWLKNAENKLANKVITMVENFIRTIG
ncbi:BLUF domain-containing protein [Flaviramulus sp. BrNp1-15]|uniref:BLUF domain-containing protein n=1 Tax=Flaviramulus sp. BrNp1-15 TaxID=2916754 RepID=UPI001EE83D89|nr:BLUF domain-containing protein [Flaviramulus sp. BrNp1-15]ULC60417.1 BLUF domain-containing protein [Flaviramulus sp. BrNp1-15]